MSAALAVGATGNGWTITGSQTDHWVVSPDDFSTGAEALTVVAAAKRLGLTVPADREERTRWVNANSPGAFATDEVDAWTTIGERHLRKTRGNGWSGLADAHESAEAEAYAAQLRAHGAAE